MRTKTKMPTATEKPLGVKRVQFKESASICKKKPRSIATASEPEEGEVVSLGEVGSQSQDIIPDSQESSIDAQTQQEEERSATEPSSEEREEGPARTLSEADYEVNSQAWPDTDASEDPRIYENNGVFVSIPVDDTCGVSRTFSEEELNEIQTLPF